MMQLMINANLVGISEREPANASDNLSYASATQDNSRICEPVKHVEEPASSLRANRRGGTPF